MKTDRIAIIIIVIIVAASISIYQYLQPSGQPSGRLVIATTTSTVDTGLLAYLKPYFESRFKANMTWLYLGTGQALAVAARGDADLLLVHDRAREDAFIKSGNGTHRITIMYNDFVIIGPQTDPAGLQGLSNATLAFQKIREVGDEGKAVFVSRGDNSGTHALELRIWKKVGVSPKGRSWYVEAGQGMSPTIRIADEKQAYTITDRGTWVKLRLEMGSRLTLQLLIEGDKDLLNPYGLILLNPKRYPNINHEMAEKFFLFMISDEGQRLIRDYKVGGEQLFYPIFGKPESIGLPSENEEVQYWIQKLIENGLSPPS